MSWFKSQVEDWKYLVSADNQTSRGFYIFITVAFTLLLVLFGFAFVLACIGKTTGVLQIVGFIGLPAVIVLIAIIMVLLSKN